MRKLAVFLGVGVLLLAVSAPFEVPFALLFGWAPFLFRTLARITVDGPSMAVGGLALVLFTTGVHWAGRAWRRRTGTPESVPPAWKLRYSLALVATVFVLFAAGISLIGMTHQVVWLLRADEPLSGTSLKTRWPAHPVNNLKYIGLSMANYHDQYASFPRGGTFAADGSMLHSWETYLLPYLNYLSKDIDLNRPWNDAANAPYFRSVIPEFINPGFRTADFIDGDGYGLSHYAANSRVLAGNKAVRLQDIPASPATLLLVGEVNARFQPWGHPVNWRDPVRGINRSPDGFGGPRGAGGAYFGMADGGVRFIDERISPEVLRALSSPDHRERIDEGALGAVR